MSITFYRLWLFIDPDEFEKINDIFSNKEKQTFSSCDASDEFVYKYCTQSGCQTIDPRVVEEKFPEIYTVVPKDRLMEILGQVSYKFYISERLVRMDENVTPVLRELDCFSAYLEFGIDKLDEIKDKGSIYLDGVEPFSPKTELPE